MVITDYTGTQMPNLEVLMEYYGIRKTEGVVMERSSQYYVQMPYYLILNIEDSDVTDGMTDGSTYVIT